DSRRSEWRLPALRRARVLDSVSRPGVACGPRVSLGHGTVLEGRGRDRVPARPRRPAFAAIVPALRRERRRPRAAYFVGALVGAFSISCRVIGYSPTRFHWVDPYFAKSSTLASTNWLFASISCRDWSLPV